MRNCEDCLKKNLFHMSQWWTGNRRWGQCRNCKHWQLEDPPQGLAIPSRILYLDIERSLMSFWGYELAVRNGYISKDMIREQSFIICWAAGWVGGKVIRSDCVTQKEALRRDDKRVMRGLWDLMDQADVITGHNVHDFDWKHVNTRFLVHGMGQPVVSKASDTLKVAKKHFKFDSNSLDWILRMLGELPKKEIRMDEWLKVVTTGDPGTLRKVVDYCKHDVRQGKRVFDRFTKHSPYGVLTPLTTI